jgi:hypothetical protein
MTPRFPRAFITRGLFAAVLVAFSACHLHPGINPTVEQESLTPPRPLSGGGPALVGATRQTPVALEIIVQIDTLGKADISTLQITGDGVEANRPVIRDWLRRATFEPALLNGYPVRGWYRVLVEAKARGVRD